MQEYMKKFLISLFAVLIFIIMSLSWTYELTDMIFGKWLMPTSIKGCPTTFGLTIHALIFFLIVFGSMFIPWNKLK